MKATITKRRVDAMTPGDVVADDVIQGFVARCLPSGRVTYGFRFRGPNGRRWKPLGLHGSITPDQARTIAKGLAGDVARARDPIEDEKAAVVAARRSTEARTRTVAWLLDEFMVRYVRGRLRSADEIERTFNVYVRPRIGTLSIYDVRRSQVVKMLDEIEDQNGPVMADRTLAHVRKAFAWQAARDDAFNSPVVRGMSRTKPRERARDRALSDAELRDVWAALGRLKGPYPALVRVLLFTAQRREEVAGMRRREIDGAAWSFAAERAKGKLAQVVPLTPPALAEIEAQPLRTDTKGKPDRDRDFIFSKTGRAPFSGFSRGKVGLDAEIAKIRKAERREPMPAWVLHDLRRTARSLMSRAGVPSDIAERVLGHVVPGVRGVYDRHAYADEKRDALKRLAAVIAKILEPPPAGKVVKLRA